PCVTISPQQIVTPSPAHFKVRHFAYRLYCFAQWDCFFFQAEDGIRDDLVTGVQTCALPISLRATYLYYFLDGGARVDPTASFNGDGFGPGHVHINADFYRVSLDYERLLMSDYGAFLTGSLGLTYVHLDPKLSWQGHRSHEDF